MNPAPALSFRGVVKHHTGFTLGPLDLTVPRGSIYGLIGPNGAGKTTAIDLVFGMGATDTGEIHAGTLDHRRDEVAFKHRVAYASPELDFSTWGRVGKALRFVRGFCPRWDQARCADLLRLFELDEETAISALSFGARMKLALLLALVREPDVLVLDEPTTGLDAIAKQVVFAELLRFVSDGERAVLLSSHGLTDVERFADHLGIIRGGRLLLEGRTDSLVERHRLAEFDLPDHARPSETRGLRVLRRSGTRWHGLLDLEQTGEAELQAAGARGITLSRLSLEDIFVALMKEPDAEVAA